jgi:hypothetical protein
MHCLGYCNDTNMDALYPKISPSRIGTNREVLLGVDTSYNTLSREGISDDDLPKVDMRLRVKEVRSYELSLN